MENIPHFVGNTLSLTNLNKLVDGVNLVNGLIGDGIIKVEGTDGGKTISLDVESLLELIPKTEGGSDVRRAKTQAAMSAATSVSVKLLDYNGDVEGDAITANFFTSTTLADESIIPVFQDVDDNWYCAGPVRATSSETVITDTRMNTTSGALEHKTRSVAVFATGDESDWTQATGSSSQTVVTSVGVSGSSLTKNYRTIQIFAVGSETTGEGYHTGTNC